MCAKAAVVISPDTCLKPWSMCWQFKAKHAGTPGNELKIAIVLRYQLDAQAAVTFQDAKGR